MKKAVFVLVLASLLAGCVSASPQPENPATSTIAPPQPSATKTTTPPASTPTLVPVPTLLGLDGIPAPEEEFITAMVSENYLRVMGLAREQVQIVYREHHAASGESFVVMLDETTGVPLAVYVGEWEQATLKFFGNQLGIKIGTNLLGYNNVHANFVYINQYETATIDTYWLEQKIPNGKDNSELPSQIQWLTSKGITDYTVHCMLFPGSHPKWLQTGNYSQDELRVFMQARIDSVIKNAPNASIYIVVNEPYLPESINPERAQYDSFYRAWGNSYEYIKEAFEYARESLDKAGRQDAKLVFNDSDNHYSIGQSSSASRQIVAMLHEEGLIDYVGMQMHIGEWEKGAFDNYMVPGIPKEVEFYKNLGVPVIITELTYDPSEEEQLLSAEDFNKRLSHVFTTIFRLALQSKNVEQITFWSLTDLHLADVAGWYQIFDKEGNPKPAFYEILRTLYEHIP